MTLLDYIKLLPGGAVYTLADKSAVLMGFRLYEVNSVINILWNQDKTALSIDIISSSNCTVDIYLKGENINYECDCGKWNLSKNCAHVICALLTIKNLIQPQLFKFNRPNTIHRDYLNEALLNENKHRKKPLSIGYALYLENIDDDISIYITNKGKKIDYYQYDSHLMSKDIKNILNIISFVRFDRSHIISYFTKETPSFPIIFKNGAEETIVTWDSDREYLTNTSIDTTADTVTINKSCSIERDSKKEILVYGDFVFDLESKKFSIITHTEGWTLWRYIFKACKSSLHMENPPDISEKDITSFWIFKRNINMVQMRFPFKMKDKIIEKTIFRLDGKACEVTLQPKPAYEIIITLEEDYYRLTAKAIDYSLLPSMYPFLFFSAKMPSGFNTIKNKTILLKLYIDAVRQQSKKKRDELIKQGLTSGLLKNKKQIKDAMRTLKDIIDQTFNAELQIDYYKDSWILIPIDKTHEILLYSIPFELFGIKIFDDNVGHNEMLVNKAEFMLKLPILVKTFNENGINVSMAERPIKLSKIDIEFDTVKTSIDWFELSPEIRCDGQLLKKIQLEMLLNVNGTIEIDGVIHILDEASRNMLSAINPLIGSGKKDILRVPRLQILDWIHLRKNGVKVKLPIEDERIIESLTEFKKIEERPLPNGLNATLRRYQMEGYYWLTFLYEHKFGACLADDMGLGKTLQAIAFIGGLIEGLIKPQLTSSKSILIVMPPTLLFNWESEIKKFYPSLTIYSYIGSDRKAVFDNYNIILSTYAIVRRDIKILKDIVFNIIVFDEAQAIKNIFADTTGAVRQLKACFKLAMTGTPLENHIGEYYSIMDLALPGLLGQYKDFKGNIGSEGIERIIQRTKPFILRRTKEIILKELPNKIESDIYLELTEKQKVLYNKTIQEVKSTIDEAYRTKTGSVAKIIALTALLKLRQICLSCELVNPDINGRSPKIEFLKSELEELFAEGYSALVFSQFTSFLDIVEAQLIDTGYKVFRLDGGVPVAKRKRLVADFMECEAPSLFLLSLKAGGQGLNLTKASYVFHLDPWWNPAVENQASDRAHRIGQKNKVIVTRILMRHTLEEKIMELKQRKLELYKAILDSPTMTAGFAITREDFNYILSPV